MNCKLFRESKKSCETLLCDNIIEFLAFYLLLVMTRGIPFGDGPQQQQQQPQPQQQQQQQQSIDIKEVVGKSPADANVTFGEKRRNEKREGNAGNRLKREWKNLVGFSQEQKLNPQNPDVAKPKNKPLYVEVRKCYCI